VVAVTVALLLAPLAAGQPEPPPAACTPPRSTTLLENDRGRVYAAASGVDDTGRLDTYTCEFASGHTFQLDDDLNRAYRPPAMALAGDLFVFVLDFESRRTEVILGNLTEGSRAQQPRQRAARFPPAFRSRDSSPYEAKVGSVAVSLARTRDRSRLPEAERRPSDMAVYTAGARPGVGE